MTIAQLAGNFAARVTAFSHRLDELREVTDPEENLVERVAALEAHVRKLSASHDFHVPYVFEAIEALYRGTGDEPRAELHAECGALTQIVDGIQHKRWAAEHAEKNGVPA